VISRAITGEAIGDLSAERKADIKDLIFLSFSFTNTG
jgi:hypothetical protein